MKSWKGSWGVLGHSGQAVLSPPVYGETAGKPMTCLLFGEAYERDS